MNVGMLEEEGMGRRDRERKREIVKHSLYSKPKTYHELMSYKSLLQNLVVSYSHRHYYDVFNYSCNERNLL